MVPAIPAILTLGGVLACISAPSKPISWVSQAAAATEEIPSLELVRIELDPPIRVPVTTANGRRAVGPWVAMTVEGLESEDGSRVPWSDLAAAERLRVGRRVVGSSKTDSPLRWGLLVVSLRAIEDGPMAKRATEQLERQVGEDWPRWDQAVAEAVSRRRGELEARARDLEEKRLLRIPPHLKFDHPAPWPTLDADQWKTLCDTQRDAALAAVEGLEYASVATARTLVVGPGSMDEQGAFGVKVDQLQDDVVEFLGLSPSLISWPARMVVFRPADRRTARILAANIHRAAWPDDAESLVIPSPDGPIVILAPIDDPAEADAELVRAVARGVLPYLETGRRLPSWLVEGIAEASADHLVPSLGIDRIRRPRAHRALRGGRDPVWITTLSMDDPAWGPDGLARDVAQVMAIHLREHAPESIGTVIRGIKAGGETDTAFRAGVGMSLPEWTADSLEWFHFND